MTICILASLFGKEGGWIDRSIDWSDAETDFIALNETTWFGIGKSSQLLKTCLWRSSQTHGNRGKYYAKADGECVKENMSEFAVALSGCCVDRFSSFKRSIIWHWLATREPEHWIRRLHLPKRNMTALYSICRTWAKWCRQRYRCLAVFNFVFIWNIPSFIQYCPVRAPGL